MKFSTHVKLVSLLAVFLLMLSGLPVVSAQAAQGITDPALNAFFHPDPKPGASANSFNLVSDDVAVNNKVDIKVFGWNGINEMLGSLDSKVIEPHKEYLIGFMNKAKSHGVNKVFFTLYEITGKDDFEPEEDIDWMDSTYQKTSREVFLSSHWDTEYDNWKTCVEKDVLIHGMGGDTGKVVGIFTFAPADAGITPVDPKVLAAIQDEIAKKLGITTVVDGADATVKTGTEVTAGNKAKTSSVISVSQSVTQGGGVVFGTVTMPVSDVSETGASLPTVSSFNELRSSYKVMKYFGGASVDLLEEFGDQLFKFSNGTAEFKKPLVVIDDARPSKDIEGLKPYGGTYGLLLTETCLIVYDGNKNGAAEDPIALEAKGGDGGGGCSAGFGLAGLLLAGLAALKYRKK